MFGGVNYNLENEDVYNTHMDLKIDDLNDFEYLTGPYTFKLMKSNKLNATCLLFGDFHVCTKDKFTTNNNSNQMYLPDYLDLLFKKYPEKQFDLLIELPYMPDTNLATNKMICGVIENIRKKFINCFFNIRDKNVCSQEYPNVRFHVIDIRYWHIPISFPDLLLLKDRKRINFNDLVHLVQAFRIFSEQYINVKKLNDEQRNNAEFILKNVFYHLYKFFKYDKRNAVQQVMTIINNNYKFKRVQEENLFGYESLIRYITARLKILFHTYDLFKDTKILIESTNVNNLDLPLLIARTNEFAVYLGAILFDSYMLLRFIKILSYAMTSNMERIPSNIIMIAGNQHLESLERFLYRNMFSFDKIINLRFNNNNIDKRMLVDKHFLMKINKIIATMISIINEIDKDILESIYFDKDMLYSIDNLVSIMTSINNKLSTNVEKIYSRIYNIGTCFKAFYQKYKKYLLIITKMKLEIDKASDLVRKNPQLRWIPIKSKIIEDNLV